MIESLLIDGKVLAHTICPFRAMCFKVSECHHTGYNHMVDYSCGTARAYDITARLNVKKDQSPPSHISLKVELKVIAEN